MKNRFSFLWMAAVVVATFLVPFRGYGGMTMYLSLTGISGESTNSAYLNQIEVNGFSWGVTSAPAVVGGGPSTPVFTDLTIQKLIDITSPTIVYDCAQGTIIPQAVLTCVYEKSGIPTPMVFYTITLQNVLISSVKPGGNSSLGDRPSESVSMSFQSITWTSQQYDNNGNAVGAPVTHSWNLAANSGS